MSREDEREGVAAALRERLREADRDIEPPPGLWERVQAPAEPTRRNALPRRRLIALASVTAIVLAIAAVAIGTWQLQRSQEPGPVTNSRTVELTVYNAEAACQPMRTMECALGLAHNPYAVYHSPGNSAGKVWHGDHLSASCVVVDGTLVQDESGVSSRRWYLVTTTDGNRAWLPGVRTRNTTDIRTCTTAEAAER